MAKSRDTLIYIDAPGRRYFAKQNFGAKISQAEVCKVKKRNINNLRIYAYHLCNKSVRKTRRKAMFCNAKSRQHGLKRRPSRLQKAVNRIAKGGLLQDERPQTAMREAVSCPIVLYFMQNRWHSSVDTLASFHTVIIAFWNNTQALSAQSQAVGNRHAVFYDKCNVCHVK